ncbi:hypothetical protein Bhyg_16333 [Pseudolycoriella hygida]|uniref:ZP domain-containing protein n=1 Tax=Pseudolycoriella hygida TaxID=35572 RepID=A0A9Q0MMG0_9DIPT|nr:hypothetical protein Bhyg_16333 [Pseudolycoriella hygida]
MSAFVRYVVILLCCSILVVDLSFSEITRTLKPPYLRNNFNPYYIPDTTSTTTAEAFIPEIIVNRNLRDEFNSVRQSDGFFPYLNNSYLPPSNQPPLMDIPETTLSTRPPISFDPIDTPTAYIPPTVAQNPNDVMSDFPPKATSNPDGYKYLPPTQQPPTVQQDPDLSDNFIPVISPPSQAYLPSQSKARELRDELIFRDPENVQSSQLQLDLNELRCLPNAGGYFRATLSVQSFVQNLPVVENDIQDLRCDLQVIRTRIVINIASVDFRRCGVENCGSQQLCLKIRFPQIQGLRTLADSVLTLQCRTQDRVVSKTHALRIGLNRENQARAAGTLANGGSQLPFRTQMGIYRLGNNGFTRNLEPGGVVLLGEELMLRAHVKFGDGWNFTRISDVSLQRLNPSGDILNSVVLVTSSGCVHPSMRSICPQPPTFEPPLGHRFGFRAVMFQGMRSGDEMIMSVKIVGCIDQSDCFVDKLACEKFSGRARRDTNLSNNLSEVSTISFRVELQKNDSNGTNRVAANNTGIMSLILSLSFIVMAMIICLIIKLKSCARFR